MHRKSRPPHSRHRGSLPLEACILAGGLATRMGRDKSRLRLGGRTLTAILRSAARAAGLRVRVLRRDRVPRCGPLGGVFPALAATRAEAVLFLSCDMPFVSPELLRLLARKLPKAETALFTVGADPEELAGFPFVIRREALAVVEQLIGQKRHSLQGFARAVKFRPFRPPMAMRGQLLNINSPEDWALARRRWRCSTRTERCS